MKSLKEKMNQPNSIQDNCSYQVPITYVSKLTPSIGDMVNIRNSFSFKNTKYERECNRFCIKSIATKQQRFCRKTKTHMIYGFVDRISGWDGVEPLSKRGSHCLEYLKHDIDEYVDFGDIDDFL